MQSTNVILEDAQQRASVTECVLELAISFLSIRDLLAVSTINHHFLHHVRSREDIWSFFYNEFDSMVDNRPFMESNAECRCEMKRLLMRIPPRMHGRKVDQDLFQSHPQDHAARQHDWGPLLYCMELGICPYWDIGESGELLDVFVMEGTTELVYLPREFPVYCQDCNNWLDSTQQLVEHCKSDFHLFAREPRLVDPRSHSDFYGGSAFEKTKALAIYPLTVASIFRNITESPSSQEVMDTFTEIVQHVMRRVVRHATGATEGPEISDCTTDLISEFCTDYITDGFFSGDKYALLTIYAGWQPTYGYFLHGLGSYLCNQTSDFLLSNYLNDGQRIRVLCFSEMELFGL